MNKNPDQYRNFLDKLAEHNPQYEEFISLCSEQIDAIWKSEKQKYREAIDAKKTETEKAAQNSSDKLGTQVTDGLPRQVASWVRLSRSLDGEDFNPQDFEMVVKAVFKDAGTAGLLPSKIVAEAISGLKFKI